MSERDQRKEFRIPAQSLPERYRRFSVLLPHESETEVTTTDASLTGFGFFSSLPPESFVVGSRLVLYPLGSTHPVYGTVVHANTGATGTRVGVSLQPIGGYAAFVAAIRPLLPDAAPS